MTSTRSLVVASAVLCCMSSGCMKTREVLLRSDGSPGPEECPEKALETMRILRLQVGDAGDVELDVNQTDDSPIRLYEGPIESMLNSSLGILPATTRLYGRVWTSGPQAVIRYYEAHPPDGDPIAFCAVARLSHGQLKKKSESPPGVAILEFSSAAVYIVNAFR